MQELITNHAIIRELGVKVNSLPCTSEALQRISDYLKEQHKFRKNPNCEEVRKIFSPSSGWKISYIHKLCKKTGCLVDLPKEINGRLVYSKCKIYPPKLKYVVTSATSCYDSTMNNIQPSNQDFSTIKTNGIKYIGSKRTLLPVIGSYVTQLKINSAIDVFTGTTRVAQFFRQMGIKTYTSDLAWASKGYANAFVHNGDNKHLQSHVDKMNSLRPIKKWLTKNYCGDVPESAPRGDGRCWQQKNAMKADAARYYVKTLEGTLKQWEIDSLIVSIIIALDKVDNTVGVQQAYLKEWCSRSKNDIIFQLPPCVVGVTAEHFGGDALKIDYPQADMAYLDPPYSPHSYATYYHIWDSIYKWDEPDTDLTAKRRVDRVSKHPMYKKDMESKWNLRDKSKSALKAFGDLIERLPVRYVVISYSDESIIEQQDLRELCEKFDSSTKVIEVDYRRNIMSQIGNAAKDVTADTLPENAPKKSQKNKELIIFIDKHYNKLTT